MYRGLDYIHSPSGMTEPVILKVIGRRKSLIIFRILLNRMNMPAYLPTHDEILRQNLGK